MALEKALLDQLAAQHGDIYTLTRAGVDIVIRGPKLAEYEQFQSMAQISDDPQARLAAVLTLVRACVVHPSPQEFEALRARKPAIISADNGIFAQVAKIAGAEEKEEAKKYERA